jgi:hypothetical protein
VVTFIIAAVSAIAVIVFTIPPVAAAIVVSVDNADKSSGLAWLGLTVDVDVWFSSASGIFTVADLLLAIEAVLVDGDPSFSLIAKTAKVVINIAFPSLAFAVAGSGRTTFTLVSLLDPMAVVKFAVSRVFTGTGTNVVS